MIESRSNARIKKIQKLRKSARYRRQEALFVAEGWKMTEEALRRSLVKTIYISTTVENEFRQRFPMQKFSEAEVEILSESLFREISDTVSPQGIMALVNMPCYDREDVVGGGSGSVPGGYSGSRQSGDDVPDCRGSGHERRFAVRRLRGYI